MPQAFTTEQMEKIRARLFESACRHAVEPGLKKTSLDALTADAGISKSTFYKFYESKELLFQEEADYWEGLIISETERVLHETTGKSSKERAAAAVNAAFNRLAELNAMRFLREDLPLLTDFFSKEALKHYRSMSLCIFETLKREQIQFTVSEEIICSVIHILYLCVQNVRELGDSFADALRELVLSACEKMVA